MAKLKQVLDQINEVPGPLRDFYEQAADGKHHLCVDGDSPKLAEFRSRNIALMKENDDLRAKFEGVDPVEYRALKSTTKQSNDG